MAKNGDATLIVASYNIHRCIGSDGRRNPQRIGQVISEIEADVIGLQEVDSSLPSDTRSLQIDGLVPDAYTTIFGPTLLREDSTYGNAFLTSRPVTHRTFHDLSVPGREPRGAIEVGIQVEGVEVHIVTAHLGLSWRERRRQAKRLLKLIETTAVSVPFILMGDFNEWNRRWPWCREMECLMGKSPAPRTFPARMPMLSLDRIWVRPLLLLQELKAHVTPLARIASDHLPIKARLRCPSGTELPTVHRIDSRHYRRRRPTRRNEPRWIRSGSR